MIKYVNKNVNPKGRKTGELLGLDYETKINELVEDLKVCA